MFDVAVGERAISHMGHIKMMGARPAVHLRRDLEDGQPARGLDRRRHHGRLHGGLAPRAEGARDLPRRLEDRAGAAHRREGEEATAEPPSSRCPQRHRLPRERESLTHKFSIAGHEGYITAGKYEDGSLGEIFLTDIGKDGSTLRGMMNAFATAISIGLQYGVPLETFVRKFSYMRFDPEGMTTNPEIPFAKSLPDYIMRWLASRFLDRDGPRGARHHERGGPRQEDGRGDRRAPPANGGQRPLERRGHERPRATARANGRGREAKPPTAALTDSRRSCRPSIEGLDLGPACSQCGGMMQRTGCCYTCSSCGNNTGSAVCAVQRDGVVPGAGVQRTRDVDPVVLGDALRTRGPSKLLLEPSSECPQRGSGSVHAERHVRRRPPARGPSQSFST